MFLSKPNNNKETSPWLIYPLALVLFLVVIYIKDELKTAPKVETRAIVADNPALFNSLTEMETRFNNFTAANNINTSLDLRKIPAKLDNFITYDLTDNISVIAWTDDKGRVREMSMIGASSNVTEGNDIVMIMISLIACVDPFPYSS